ncbi:MAG: hypothetical protein M0R06_01020 [Sphaerochaeta sp.]|jgi:hypothetical protein|nr:hypothetical protein [Sphaerochaeta sp.]
MTDTELMDDPTSELFEISVQQVDLVGRAANRRKWLLLKSDEELDDDAIDALIEEEVKDAVQETEEKQQETEVVKGGDGSGFFGHEGRPGEVGGSLPEGAGPGRVTVNTRTPSKQELEIISLKQTLSEVGERMRLTQIEVDHGKDPAKVSRAVKDLEIMTNSYLQMLAALKELESEVTKSDTEGGDTMENEELKKAQEEMEVLKKAVADAEVAKTEALAKAEAAEAIIKEQKKAARQHEVEDLCKAANLDFETLYKSELADAEVSAHFVGVIETLVKQVNALTGQEVGTAKVDTMTDLAKAEALARERNIPLRDAIIEINKS